MTISLALLKLSVKTEPADLSFPLNSILFRLRLCTFDLLLCLACLTHLIRERKDDRLSKTV